MINIGKALKQRRLEEGLTQTQLSKKTNISQQNISRWENNTHTPTIKDCIILANFYDITLDDLVDREINYKNNNQVNKNIYIKM